MVWPPPAPQLLPGQVQASVPASFLVPDISFTFWFSLILIKMCNCYISLRFYSKIHFLFRFSDLIPLGRLYGQVFPVYILDSFRPQRQTSLLDWRLHFHRLPPPLLWAHLRGGVMKWWEVTARFTTSNEGPAGKGRHTAARERDGHSWTRHPSL